MQTKILRLIEVFLVRYLKLWISILHIRNSEQMEKICCVVRSSFGHNMDMCVWGEWPAATQVWCNRIINIKKRFEISLFWQTQVSTEIWYMNEGMKTMKNDGRNCPRLNVEVYDLCWTFETIYLHLRLRKDIFTR